MKTNLLIPFLFFFNLAFGTNYYFSAISGDDSRTLTQAKNFSTPWKTLGKLNSFFSSLQPGDSVLLKRGETFYGSLTITKSGTASAPIVISAYGTGNKPVITSLFTLSNWVSKGSGIWESYNSSLGSTVNLVLLNGIQQEIGRYPNSDADNKGYLNFESHVGTTSITDNEFASITSWAGAELVVRPRRWIIDRSKITSNTATSISYSPAISCEPYDKMGYFIQNSIKTLDKFGEWYYDPATKKLSVYFGSNSPSSYTIQATAIADLISSNNISNVVFDNLTIKGANEDGFSITSGTNMTVKNCDILFSGKTGIIANMHDQFKLENSTISNSNHKGLDLGFSSDYAVVRNNKISNTGMIAGMNGNYDGSCIAIYSWGNGNLIEYNELRNTGYDGIYFNGSDVTIKNNLIDSFCLVKDDGAGMYTHAGSVVYKNRKITGNVIINGLGAGPGTGTPGSFPASGIYLDNNASPVEITGNTLANCNRAGIYIHNCFGMTIKNNTLFNNATQVNMTEDADNVAIRNIIATNNIFFSKLSTQLITYLTSSADDIGLFGRFDSNYYARPIDDRITIYNHYPGFTCKLDLAGWKQKYSNDAASKITAKQIAAYNVISLAGSNRVANGAFTTSISGVHTTSCTVAFSSSGLLDGGYLQVSPLAKASSVNMSIGGITAGKKYILKYSVRGSIDDNMVMGAYLRQGVSPYANLTSSQYRKVAITRTDNEMIFVAPSTQTSVVVVLSTDQQSKYYLDNIQVFEAEATITNPDDSLRFVYNVTSVTKSVYLNGNYINVKGDTYSNNIDLQPYSSAILMKTGGGAQQNIAPTVSITSPSINSKFAAPASIIVNATATDADGSVVKVDFYNGNTLLGSDNTSPYSFTWDSVSAGSYSLTAKATDNGSLVTTSSTVSVSISNFNVAPAVNITSPVINGNYTAPLTIRLTAVASDIDGTISKVEFYNGTTLLHTETVTPYEYLWKNIPAGEYSITAKATDDKNLTTTSTIVLMSVRSLSGSPTVSITSPVTNAKFNAPANITIIATANDADGSITKVDFYNKTTLLGTDYTSPYSFTWNGVSPGNYSFTAKATDNSSLTTTSAAVPVSASISTSTSNKAPTVSITSPATNTQFKAPANITITATASDVDGSINRVQFYNETTLLGSDYTSPYSFTWNGVSAGNYSFTAKATDDSSATTTSTAVTVSASNTLAKAMNEQKNTQSISSETIGIIVRPNPTTSLLSVFTNGLQKNKELKISVLSVTGKLFKTIQTNTANQIVQVNVSSLAAGMYLVQVVSGDMIIYKQFLKW